MSSNDPFFARDKVVRVPDNTDGSFNVAHTEPSSNDPFFARDKVVRVHDNTDGSFNVAHTEPDDDTSHLKFRNLSSKSHIPFSVPLVVPMLEVRSKHSNWYKLATYFVSDGWLS